MNIDSELRIHQEWIGYLQPVGLVVSPVALCNAQAYINRHQLAALQRLFLDHVEERKIAEDEEPNLLVTDLPGVLHKVFGWQYSDLVGFAASQSPPTSLEVHLPAYDETLKPDYCVREPEPKDPGQPWLMLIQCLQPGADFDSIPQGLDPRRWQASYQVRFERLLRETKVPIGLLFNGTDFRLVYAPIGENSGHITFPVQYMCEIEGRTILGALHLLINAERLFTLPSSLRLPALLENSRKYQSQVSTALSRQVLASLYELLRGFQTADALWQGKLLSDTLARDPDLVYAGLLTTLMRLVFILYAEDRGLLPQSPLYQAHFSVVGLFERLRDDAARNPDTMDQRYGAWAQLLTLFRIIYDGANHGDLRLPPRHGHLFDPERYPFLEGRSWGESRSDNKKHKLPLISDGVIYRVLQNLLILDGERLSYRTLDVEQIGSVYETMMGFRLEIAQGPSIAIKPKKPHGAPVTINLEELLREKPDDRKKWLREKTGQLISEKALEGLCQAQTPEDAVAALKQLIDREASPNIVPRGAMILQPSEERRRSGSHYTPRSLTEPIVRKALEPILKNLGPNPEPEKILELKICDMAMGSGAFLVETCRQLGDVLVNSWHYHNKMPAIPPDEDESLHARRLIAQRCIYGVDKNPMAVDLAKLSLWLATLAKDHPFTFLDHNLKAGDSLVGLTCQQIADFHWEEEPARIFSQVLIEENIQKAIELRQKILSSDESVSPDMKQEMLKDSDKFLNIVRLVGDCVISAFFAGGNNRQRQQQRNNSLAQVLEYLKGPDPEMSLNEMADFLKRGPMPIRPFHWEIEFPEVFSRENGGFDAIIGNPPFAGKNTLIAGNREGYLDWLKTLHKDSHGNSDVVAHFYRRSFSLIRQGGCIGLIATNTIGQGDTRNTGLRWICTHGGTIYSAKQRYKWPGQAAVVISVVHISKGPAPVSCTLNDKEVPKITSYLFHMGGHEDPKKLRANLGKSFQGSIILGMGFTFDDTDTSGVATPIIEMERLIAKDPKNREVIFPYIGGEEVNTSPIHAHHRYVINFEEMSAEEARQWPDLFALLEQKVKPYRAKHTKNPIGRKRAKYWWQYGSTAKALYDSIRGLNRIIVINCGATPHMAFTFLSTSYIFANSLAIIASDSYAVFCVLQSYVHEVWARFFGSTLEDRLRYTPTDCFETFPFPKGFETNQDLENAGRVYYEFRANLMVQNNEGLTKTYNRFHDPGEDSPGIKQLRDLHAQMDRIVLDAYGWNDIPTAYDFFLDYEEEEEEEEGGRKRKKPWRYRWPDEIRDEVLARLLALNEERAREEREAEAALGSSGLRRKRGRRRVPHDEKAMLLPNRED